METFQVMTWHVLLLPLTLPLPFLVYVMPILSGTPLLTAGMRGPRISEARMHQCGQKTWTKCQRGPVEAGDASLGHFGLGFFNILLTGGAPGAPSPANFLVLLTPDIIFM